MHKSTIALLVVAVLFVGTPVAAQQQLWSATMTAGEIDYDEGVIGVGYQVPTNGSGGGELSNKEFSFRGTTYTVGFLFQYQAGDNRPIGGIRIGVGPGLGEELDVASLTVTADGQPLELDRVLTDVPEYMVLQYLDPGLPVDGGPAHRC